MPAVVLQPQKRVLGDATKLHRNSNPLPSPNSAKRRKLDTGAVPAATAQSQDKLRTKLGSSQPKSQFEVEVLEKLTQDIHGLKQQNSEKDQQWDRPPLNDFDEHRDSLCFQQIEAEDGTLHGGKTTVKLFGITEASMNSSTSIVLSDNLDSADWTLRITTCYWIYALPLCCSSSQFCST